MFVFRSNAFAWFLRTDASDIAEFMVDEFRSEFLLCYAALLALAND